MNLNFTYHEKQAEAFSFRTRFLILPCGRRWGKTEGSVQWGIEELAQTTAPTGWFVSHTYKQAEIAFRKLLKILRRPENRGFKFKAHKSQQYIEYDNGKETQRFEFRSAQNPDSLVGEGLGSLVVDEAGLLPNELWYQALLPTLTDVGARAVFLGTPRGKRSGHEEHYFYRLYMTAKEGNNDFTFRQYSSYDNPFIKKTDVDKLVEEMRKSGRGEDYIRQEVYGEFLGEQGSVFINPRGCVVPAGEIDFRINKNHFYTVGIDIGKWQDYTVILVIDNDQRAVVRLKSFRGLPWDEVESAILEISRELPPHGQSIRIDATNQEMWVEKMAHQYQLPVEPVRIYRNTKVDLVMNLIRVVEKRDVRIPEPSEKADTTGLIQELEDFQEITTKSMNIKYEAAAGSHDDHVIALALAVQHLPPSFEALPVAHTTHRRPHYQY